MKTFGQFVAPPPKSADDRLRETVLTHFGQGEAAAKRGKPRSANPHRPFSDQVQYEAWNCGWDEATRLRERRRFKRFMKAEDIA